ncbi:response regulator [Oscillatoria acuminata]|uniref:histidine kinase n=1 Tax=Oscillatoria acuminata PCC 6304 TaxID=56110 RepID=K9TPG9_9CYAN|nr:response regulator [Oscillatoria acuminata]AFY84450.1 signal transduction histidine kinase [Oscillatoria acuminata PCC 6304]
MSIETDSKPKLLVVDDEPDNLDLLYRTFYRNYQVFTAENASQALELLAQEGDVAVIISDQRMPQMSGTELLSLTATQYPDAIRIILTAYTDVEDLVDAINEGKVFKYVTKPWDADELKALVAQALDTHNVLKARTRELCRTLRQESLLNAITNTIRSRTTEAQILQTIVDTLGQMFEVSYCILRPYQDGRFIDEWFMYQKRELGTIKSNGQGPKLPLAPSGPISEPLGLAQTVWETHDIEVINDVETDERLQGKTPQLQQRRQMLKTADIRSCLVVPLMFRLELMAVLALHQCGSGREWQDDEVQLVFMVADQAVLSLSQARAYEQVQALAQREALVNTITTAIRSSLNPKDIFAAIAQQLGQALQADGCALSLWTEEDEYVQCVGLYDAALQAVEASEGEQLEDEGSERVGRFSPSAESALAVKGESPQNSGELPRSVVPIAGNPVLQELLTTRAPVVVDDLEEQPEWNVMDLPLRSPARALLLVPLISDGEIIGSITLRQVRAPRRWHPSEIELAQAVAAQGAIAVHQSRLYQKTRQQAERLLELNRLKTEFFQNISHEFRTPLTLMMGPLESAVEHHQDLPLEQAAIALRNTRRLLRLVNQLLDLQRLDAGRMQPTFRPCDLLSFVSQTVEIFRPYCEKKGIEITIDLQPCPSLYLDLEKFDKVLYNLLSNAMKFTASGGKIMVSLEQAGDYSLLQVKDTGIGIRTDQVPHLFERFRQAEGSANRSYEGSGLGLALAKELVELHGGTIAVESNYGEGSAFMVWLPLGNSHLPPDQIIEVPTGVEPARASVELADVQMEEDGVGFIGPGGMVQPAEPSTIHTLHPTIVVVDDNPDLRNYVSGILTKEGYRVILARNGAEGFDVVINHRPQLIVTDLMMPLVSGLDMIQMIREDESLRGTPIILLTAKVNEDTRIEGAEKGADAYLAKPFNDRELLAEVRNLLALKENERRVAQLNTYLTESVLRRFLPPSMVQKAASGELSLDLRPEPRLITILFSDIVGFTQLANTLRSRRVAEVLNQYLTEMTQAVFDNGGTVDKFVGDAIVAMFGAPEDLTPNEQVRRAIATARQMLQALDRLNENWEEQGLPRVQFRCGIHQGTAVVGMFGGNLRSDYTAIGPSVNIASRLQEAADPGTILVSAAVADYLHDDEIVKFASLQLKGIDETVLTFMVHRHSRGTDGEESQAEGSNL